jgi:hypothetical protein
MRALGVDHPPSCMGGEISVGWHTQTLAPTATSIMASPDLRPSCQQSGLILRSQRRSGYDARACRPRIRTALAPTATIIIRCSRLEGLQIVCVCGGGGCALVPTPTSMFTSRGPADLGSGRAAGPYPAQGKPPRQGLPCPRPAPPPPPPPPNPRAPCKVKGSLQPR